jgi:hypothetical protein
LVATAALTLMFVPTAEAETTSVDLAIIRVKVTDLVTGSHTEAMHDHYIRFVPVLKNIGPGVASQAQVQWDWDQSNFFDDGLRWRCPFGPYFVASGSSTKCVYGNIPVKGKASANNVQGMVQSWTGDVMYARFCVTSLDPAQIDPNPAYDCLTGYIAVI